MKIPWTFLENLVDAILIYIMEHQIHRYTRLNIFVIISISCKILISTIRPQLMTEENNRDAVQVRQIRNRDTMQLLTMQILSLILRRINTDALMDCSKKFKFLHTILNSLPLMAALDFLYAGVYFYNLFYGCCLLYRFMHFCTTTTYKYLMSIRSN